MSDRVIAPTYGQNVIINNKMSTEFRNWVSQVTERQLISDSGAPEGVIDAGQNALYLDQDTNNVYVKTVNELNNDSTQGWVLVTGEGAGGSWGSITGTLSDQTDLQAALDGKVDDAQVLTNVPAGAVFTDTTYTNVSEFVNDAGYLTSVPANVMVEGENVSLLVNDAGYYNSSNFIAGTDYQAPLSNVAFTNVNNNFTSSQSITGSLDVSSAIDALRIVAGNGTGSVALTVNDGYGNAQVTLNHEGGVPDVSGNAFRISGNVDSTTNATLSFQVGQNVTGGVATALSQVLGIGTGGISVTGNITVTGTVDGVDIAALDTQVQGLAAGSLTQAHLANPATSTIQGSLGTGANVTNLIVRSGGKTFTLDSSTFAIGDYVLVDRQLDSISLFTVTVDSGSIFLPDGTNAASHTMHGDKAFRVKFTKYDSANWVCSVY
jgi:hypothetical protein